MWHQVAVHLLPDEADLPQPIIVEPASLEIQQILPRDGELPGCRAIEPAQQVQQGAFARPARSDDRHHFSLRHLEIDAAQRHDLVAADLIRFDELPAADHGPTTTSPSDKPPTISTRSSVSNPSTTSATRWPSGVRITTNVRFW